MAEVGSQATLTVDVQGESGLQRLANALQKIKRDSGTAGSRPQAVSATRQAQGLAVQWPNASDRRSARHCGHPSMR